MSAEGPSLQAQVESLLSALVKTAAVELTRLFESRYSASAAAAAEVGRIAGQKEPGTAESRPAVNTKHSVGVQVDESVYPVQEPDDSTTFPDQLCNCKEEEKGDLIPIGLLLSEENGYMDSLKSSPSREMSDDSSDLDGLDSKEPNDGETGTEVVLQVFMDSPVRSSLEEQKPLVLLAGNPNVTVDENVAFVCPLILKPETPGPNLESWMAESHQAGVSTAGGTAYSPSPSDGAMSPVLASLPETTKLKPNVRLNMNLNTPDQKLLRPCGVKLVNILTIPDSYLKPQDNPNLGHPLPKELRRHQGVHTGHRLCCFDPCENGVWRLQSIVAHCRDGYTCSNCGKTFKRRKILRRHERFHTGEKPYQCVVCAKTFALKKSLRRHLRFHTGERPHSCTQCDKSFRLRETLKAHMGFHSGEKPFSCATCGKTFRIRRNLEKHQLSQCGFFVPSFKMIAGR